MILLATCKNCEALPKKFRFVGQYEFPGNAATDTDEVLRLKVFEALDFDTDTDGQGESRRVMLQCYLGKQRDLLPRIIMAT